ncbi:MAG: carboxypeptidase regulatory-like domain-containing protein, partial [Planctomycetota bacterium]
MSRRATRPLDPEATSAADEDIYARHEGDPRPNALYDAEGNRTPLDPYDPAQADLRSEWMDLYEAHGGEVETPDRPSRETDSPAEPCPLQHGDLVVTVLDADGSPVEGAEVQVLGPEERHGVTGAEGHAEFTGLEPGAYTAAASKEGYVDGDAAANVAAQTTNTATVTLRRRRIRSVEIDRSPKKIIHPYNESITFTAEVEPTPPPADLTYEWSVDGTVDPSATGRTFTKQFTPAATRAERRKDYRVSVTVEGLSDDTTVRVGQNAVVGARAVIRGDVPDHHVAVGSPARSVK